MKEETFSPKKRIIIFVTFAVTICAVVGLVLWHATTPAVGAAINSSTHTTAPNPTVSSAPTGTQTLTPTPGSSVPANPQTDDAADQRGDTAQAIVSYIAGMNYRIPLSQVLTLVGSTATDQIKQQISNQYNPANWSGIVATKYYRYVDVLRQEHITTPTQETTGPTVLRLPAVTYESRNGETATSKGLTTWVVTLSNTTGIWVVTSVTNT